MLVRFEQEKEHSTGQNGGELRRALHSGNRSARQPAMVSALYALRSSGSQSVKRVPSGPDAQSTAPSNACARRC